MSADFGWLSLVPPAIAIGVALATKRVLMSLLAGVLCAVAILHSGELHVAPARALDTLIDTTIKPDNLRLVLFSILVGGLLRLMKDARAFDAFARLLQGRERGYGKRTVFGLTWLFGGSLILETWSNVLINGATMGTLYDRLRIARVRLAYFIHTIGINVVALVLVNSWGAFYLALVQAQNVPNPLDFLIRAMPYALYCWISLIVVAVVMMTGFTVGPMREFEALSPAGTPDTPATTAEGPEPRLRHMLIPIASLIGITLWSLYVTGDGKITAGDGSKSILYAVVATLFITGILLRIDRVFGSLEIEKKVIAGSAEFLDVGFLIVLALALGKLTQSLGTGPFVAQLLQSSLPVAVIPALVFLLGAIMSFATGTSYGTFSIMVPLALPIGAATGISPELLFGACIAGGVFGDNTSPISDTTIVSSVAANTQVIDHARTQLPFALIAAAISVVGFLLLGAL
jgi:Na+/H+ antiporter NhaC